MLFSKPKKLYKYLSPIGAQKLLDAPNPEIWFRLSNGLNDTHDMRPVGGRLDDFATVACFCLSETPVSAPMWAHYAFNGQGIVLEFSFDSKFFEQFPPVKVRYSNKRSTIKDVNKWLTSKSDEWAYEQEWRCLIDLRKAEQSSHKFLLSEQAAAVAFPFDALSAIIHGYDSCVSAQEFLQKPEASHVKQLVCRQKAWEYSFDVCEINDFTYIKAAQESELWGRVSRKK